MAVESLVLAGSIDNDHDDNDDGGRSVFLLFFLGEHVVWMSTENGLIFEKIMVDFVIHLIEDLFVQADRKWWRLFRDAMDYSWEEDEE